MKHRCLCLLTAMLALTAATAGQTVIAWSGVVPPPSVYDQIACVSPGYPIGAPIGTPFAGTGLLPPIPIGAPFGAVAVNNVTGIVYATDGFTIEQQNFPFYPPPGPIAVPPAFPYVGPIGPIHGMDVDPTAGPMPFGLLWVTDGVFGAAVAPIPGTPVIVPPFPIVGPVPVMAPPLTGLDWDPHTSALWAVDSAGFIYHFLPGPPAAVFLGPGPMPPGPVPFPASGLALDSTLPFAGFYVSFPGIIFEYLSGAAMPPGAAGFPNGLSFHALPARLFGAATCVAGGVAPPVLGALGAAWSGNPAFGLVLSGVTPGSPITLLFDGPNAALPFGFPFVGGALFVDPIFSPLFGMIPFGLMPPGPLVIPVPLVTAGGPVPPGFLVYTQFVALECPGAAPPLSITDALQIQVALP